MNVECGEGGLTITFSATSCLVSCPSIVVLSSDKLIIDHCLLPCMGL